MPKLMSESEMLSDMLDELSAVIAKHAAIIRGSPNGTSGKKEKKVKDPNRPKSVFTKTKNHALCC